MGLIKHSLLLICVWTYVCGDCSYQACFCDGTTIMCQGRGLTDIPPLVAMAPDNSELMFDTNNITEIHAGSLPRHLKRLTLLANPITTVDDSAFNDSTSTLEILQFSNVRFTRIPDALLCLTNLQSLTIYDATIVDWNINVMKHIGPPILTLELQNVGLTAWPTWIQYFSNLTDLNLDNGGISSLPDNAMDQLINSLTSLSMQNNSLISIPKAVYNLKVLRSLTLQNNTISDTRWLPHLSKLSTLNLGYNRISNATQLSDSLRPFADYLSTVTLQGNYLATIPDLSFLHMTDGLDFTYNKISNPQIGPVPNTIYELNLGHNLLSKIPAIFAHLPLVIEMLMNFNVVTEIYAADFSPWISIVDLSFNHIIELTDTSFPEHSNIITLNLNNNPIVRISASVFNNLQQLTELTMRYTKITRLPVGLSSLANVYYFDVDGSTDLVCTCLEKSLALWILSRPSNPGGQCGLTTIHDFFYVLSQSCP